MGCKELCGGVHTVTNTYAIGFQTHCVGVSVGKGQICVSVGQCEHTINVLKRDAFKIKERDLTKSCEVIQNFDGLNAKYTQLLSFISATITVGRQS